MAIRLAMEFDRIINQTGVEYMDSHRG